MLRRIESRLAALEAQQLGVSELGDATLALLEPAIAHDMAIWFSLDPATLLPTGFRANFARVGAVNKALTAAFRPTGLVRSFELRMMQKMVRAELEIEDSLSFGALARSTSHVATLHQVTGGDPSRSARAANFPVPNFLSDELRLMFTDAGEGWGMVWLGRRAGAFSDAEIADAAKLGPPIGRLTRLTFLRAAMQAGTGLAEPPGLVLLGPGGEVQHLSPEAERLVGRPGEQGWRWLGTLTGLEGPGRPSIVVNTPTGPVTVHVNRLEQGASLIVERARPYAVADRLVRAYGLTPREREVVGGLSKGWSTRRIAFELDLADYTVQDHLQSVFDKIGVRSRKEVLAKLFFEHYLPQHKADAVPSPYGWFLDDQS